LTRNVVTWFSMRGSVGLISAINSIQLKKILKLTEQSVQHKSKCKLGSKVL